MLDATQVLVDLAVLLKPQVLDAERAGLIVELALERVAAVVSPIPSGARPIVLDVAARAYVNPLDVDSESAGPFTRHFRSAGVYLSDGERDALLSLGDTSSGAFTIHPGSVARAPVWDSPQ